MDKKDNDQKHKPSAQDAFNRAGMRMYGTITAIPISLGICFFSLGKYMNSDTNQLFLAGVILGALGAAGAVYETVRLARESAKNSQGDDDPSPPPDPKP
jgi:hypothetical protein